jgi:alkyl sulfatase BDS1-like metallo-beta-lactamase superfamily hydrolase
MREIQLPPHLDLVQNHGKVDWAVRSIWEYYATWFHFDSTTELYPVPAREVYADLAEVAGSEGLVALGQNYLQQNKPVKVLHVMEVVLAAQPENASALRLQLQALQSLLQAAENGLRNDYEIYWLQGQIAQTQALLAPDA